MKCYTYKCSQKQGSQLAWRCQAAPIRLLQNGSLPGYLHMSACKLHVHYSICVTLFMKLAYAYIINI